MTLADLVERLGAKRSGADWSAKCPAHEDRNPSLSISEAADGKLLVHCHAGCSLEAVCAALGISAGDLFNGKSNHRNKIVATYDYCDERGALLFQVCRMDPKDFRQRQPDGAWSTKGIRKVLFRLPQVLEAVRQSRPIYVAEGEKDVLALENAGFAATCNAGGAGKWRADYSDALKGAEVIIIADKDEPGRKHARDVATQLHGIAAGAKVIELPDTNGKPVKDAADFFAAGGEAGELDALASLAPKVEDGDPWLRLADDGALMAVRQLPPVVQIVEGIITEQMKLVIGGGSKTFKTWISLHLGLCISHGVAFLGRDTVRRRVLYVNLELRPNTFIRRLQAIAKALKITIEPGWFIHLPLRGQLAGALVRDVVNRLIRIAHRFDVQVIILDPIYKLNLEGDENSSRDQTRLFNELDRLTTEADSTVVLNDHFSKGNQSEKDPLDAIRGSSAKGGDVDAAMVLRRHEVTDCYRVDLVHRELPPIDPFVLGWEFPLMRLRPDLDPEAMKKPKGGRPRAYEPAELLAPIVDRTAENPISISAWARAAGVTRQTLQGHLMEMRLKGWIMTAGEGNGARQYPTEKGRKVVEESL